MKIRSLRKTEKAAIAAAIFTVAGVSSFELYHFARYGDLAPRGMHADIKINRGDVGIPGISKSYEAILTNYGFKPIKVTVCDFVDDADERGTMVAYRVERWTPLSRNWQPVVVFDTSTFCKPYGLGIAQAHLVSKLLWPGQSVSTGEESTAARDAFGLGDKARFVILSEGDGHEISFATSIFAIDEHPSSVGAPLRVRH